MNNKYNILRVVPQGFSGYRCFDEVVEMLQFELSTLGFHVSSTCNTPDTGAINIVIGAHLLEEPSYDLLPETSIIYNLEQIDSGSKWITDKYIAGISSFTVWDYSQRNINKIQKLTENRDVHFLPIGYSPTLSRISSVAEPDIDVLFYGSINNRRATILDNLRLMGIKAVSVVDVYGKERDEFISRSKIILNLHYYTTNIFESARVSYLLSNEKAVVAECQEDTDIYPYMRSAICAAPYENLVERCAWILSNNEQRRHYEKQGLIEIKNHPFRDSLSRLVNDSVQHHATRKRKFIPRKLNLGSGKSWLVDYLNVDIKCVTKPDLTLDFCNDLPWDKPIKTQRFGTILLREGMFDNILANDVLAHLSNLVMAMTSCLKLLSDGGTMNILVPYDLSYGAWQDPTHVRAFNERSWLYYTEWFWYIGWYDWRFDLIENKPNLSTYGLSLINNGTAMEEVMRTPRAVDSLRVTLQKIKTTPEEKEFARKVFNN